MYRNISINFTYSLYCCTYYFLLINYLFMNLHPKKSLNFYPLKTTKLSSESLLHTTKIINEKNYNNLLANNLFFIH